jgi:endo-1,4-beta-xylanase
MRRLCFLPTAAIILSSQFLTQGLVAEDASLTANQVVSIWPDSPPPWDAPTEPERDTSGADGGLVADKPVIRLGFVSKPELHVFRPQPQSASDTAVVICPGGGYSILAWDLEGTEIAQWLQGIGVTAVVLKYRVPTRTNETKWLAPVQDIQRSISLVRSGAIEGVAAKRVGVLGFSAGGNASARVATADKRHYEAIDNIDQASAMPDFAVLVYPAWLVSKEDPLKLIDDLHVNEESPPMFFAHAADDRINCMSSVTLFNELKQNGVPSSLHIFASGGHGFGGRTAGKLTDAWRDLCATWMTNQGWLKQ